MNLFKRNIKINYIFTSLFALDMTRGLWMIYLASKGMSLGQIGVLEGIFHVTSFLMETPTGAIADVFGRKLSRVLGRFIQAGFIICIVRGDSFFEFTIAFILCALSWNLESGAGEALVYDSLKEVKSEDTYMNVNGRVESIIQVGIAVSLVMGGYIAVRSYDLVFNIQLFVIGVTILTGLFFTETTIGKKEKDMSKTCFLSAIKNQYVESIKTIKGNNKLIELIVMINLISAFNTTSFFYLQIHYKQNGFNEFQIGILLAIASGVAAIGGLIAHRLEKIFQEERMLFYIPILTAISLWGLTILKVSMFAYVMVAFFEIIIYVVLNDYINRLIESHNRATILSFSSMVYSVAMIIIFPVFGYIGDYFGMVYSFATIAFVASCFAIINAKTLRAKEEKKRSEKNA